MQVLGIALALLLASDAGGEPEAGSRLHAAAEQGDLETVRQLLDGEPELVRFRSEAGWTALHRAADAGSRPIVALLLARGADPNARGPDGLTPLHLARNAVAEMLLVHGAEANARTSRGTTPLHLAALSADYDTVELLVGRGADVDVRDVAGQTPLDLAARERIYAGRSLEDEASLRAKARIVRLLRDP
jgi:ankyrin repeat protein